MSCCLNGDCRGMCLTMSTVFCPIVGRIDGGVNAAVIVGTTAVFDVLDLRETEGIFSYAYTYIHSSTHKYKYVNAYMQATAIPYHHICFPRHHLVVMQ